MPCAQVTNATQLSMPEYGQLLQTLGFELVSSDPREKLWRPSQSISLLRLDREALEKAFPEAYEGVLIPPADWPSGMSGMMPGRCL